MTALPMSFVDIRQPLGSMVFRWFWGQATIDFWFNWSNDEMFTYHSRKSRREPGWRCHPNIRWRSQKGQCNPGQCGNEWRPLVTKLASNASGITWWQCKWCPLRPNLQLKQVALLSGQASSQCKWRYLVAKFLTYGSGTIWWINLEYIQMGPTGGQNWN